MKWGYESDAFDPEEVRKAQEEKKRNENELRPDGSPGLTCWTCGRVQGATATQGNCCYFCHQTLR